MTPYQTTRDRRKEAGRRDGNNHAPLCSKCDQPNDRLPQRYCRSCHADWMRVKRSRDVSHGTFCSTEHVA